MLAALTGLAAILRLPGLNSGYWHDEFNTVIFSVRAPLVQVATAFPGDHTHPFYGLMAQASVALFGEHHWSIRLPAVLFGVATIPAIYFLASAVAAELEARLAALLLAVSYHHVWFSQNARGYTVLLFVAVLSTYWCVVLMRRPRRWLAVSYALAVGLGTYTHLTMAFTAAAHACVWAVAIARQPRGAERTVQIHTALLALGGAAALAVALYVPMAAQLGEFFSGAHQRTAGVATPKWAVVELLRGLRIGFGTLGPIAVGTLALAGAVSYLRRRPLALSLFVLPGVLSGLTILVLGAATRPRFFFFLLGFALILVVRGAMECRRLAEGTPLTRLAPFAGPIVVGAMAVVSAASLRFNYQFPKQDFDGALRYVESHRQPSEPVLTAGAAMFPYASYYQTPWTPLEDPVPLESLIAKSERAWVVYAFPEYIDPRLDALLTEKCGERRVFPGTVGGGDVIVCTTAARNASR